MSKIDLTEDAIARANERIRAIRSPEDVRAVAP